VSKHTKQITVWITLGAVVIVLDLFFAQLIASEYESDVRRAARHGKVVAEAQILIRLVHDAVGADVSYGFTRNKEFVDALKSKIDQIHQHVEALHNLSSKDQPPFALESIDNMMDRTVDILLHTMDDLKNPSLSSSQLLSRSQSRPLRLLVSNITDELESLDKTDVQLVSRSFIDQRKTLFVIEVFSLAILNGGIAFVLAALRSRYKQRSIDSSGHELDE
jgi:CHASE3 domain sensor protein